MSAVQHDSNLAGKRSASILRTIERYETKRALMATWSAAGTDEEYVAQLRRETTKLRDQLRVKGVLFEDDDEL
jgi:hypothetical protein